MLNLNEQSCPFCNGERLRRYSAVAHDCKPKLVNIVECQSCQAGWQWPLQRTEAQSEQVFNQAYATGEERTYFDLDKRNTVASCQREFIETHIKIPGRLLDIGCGDGTFVRNMAQAGWYAVGLDPAIKVPVVENCSAGHLNLKSDFVADLPVGDTFDLITLWDVVEHVEKPDQLIADAVSRLAPGGMLVVETGNYQCAGRIQSDRKWWNFQMDHRWYFAPPQLRAILASAGLDRIELADRVLRPWWKGQSDVKPPRVRSLVKSILKKPWRAINAWQCHQELAQGGTQWKGWSGLEIMTMTGRKLM
jgi:SAM-dependent methyltransferase